MDRYQFEDLISEYLEGSLSQLRRTEFEEFMSANNDCSLQVESMRQIISSLNSLPKLNTSPTFMSNLMRRVETAKIAEPGSDIIEKKIPATLFGFTPAYAGMIGAVLIAIIVVAFELIPNQPGQVDTPSVIAKTEQQQVLPTTTTHLAKGEPEVPDSTTAPKTLPDHDFQDQMILVND